jgi:hypothetical protein
MGIGGLAYLSELLDEAISLAGNIGTHSIVRNAAKRALVSKCAACDI